MLSASKELFKTKDETKFENCMFLGPSESGKEGISYYNLREPKTFTYLGWSNGCEESWRSQTKGQKLDYIIDSLC